MKAFNIKTIIDPSVLELGTEIRLKNGEILTQQFAKASDFYLLKSGTVKFYLSLDDSENELEVGVSNIKLTPIGWSGFNSPGRYATTVKVDSHSASVVKWKHAELAEFFKANPDKAKDFMQEICARARDIIKIAVERLGNAGISVENLDKPNTSNYKIAPSKTQQEFVQFLVKSTFFELFDELPLEFLSQGVERRLYPANEVVFDQGKTTKGIFILESGKVRFSYSNDQKTNVSFRQVDTPGWVIGWSSTVNKPNFISAVAVNETHVYFVPQETLNRIIKLNPQFAPQFYTRLLWLIGQQLQGIRARIIATTLNQEVVAISNLIDQNSAKLSLMSPIHKVPHLLDDKLTVVDALKTLEELRNSGSGLEKSIATTALDILEEIKKEQEFYHGLVDVYNSVVQSPKDLPTEEVRKISARAYQNVFEKQNFIITGEENLPEQSGNIFIYNHLSNHTYNTLPNQFQITLDSHFISSMILMKKYNRPGLRIVRIGLSKEFAHQEYYQRQGHIDVFTDDSGEKPKKLKQQIRQMFYNQASTHINQGGNLIISPEGNSYSTDESPGPFKAGAFNLALSMKKEPWIVPLAMANFEKRVRNNVFSCIILPPFKVSDYVKDPENKAEMKKFLTEYQVQYRKYVEMAIEQCKNGKKNG